MSEEINNIFQLFEKFPWKDKLEINAKRGYIKIIATDNFILKKQKGFFELDFFDFSADQKSLIKRENYISLLVDKELNIIDFINYWINEEKNNYGYNLLRGYGNYTIFKEVFEGVEKIKISEKYKRDIVLSKNVLQIKPDKYREVVSEIIRINTKANQSRKSLLNYFINQLKFDFLNKKISRITFFSKGDFDFQVHRLNLKTKRKKEDFKKYLNDDDIESLGQLFERMLKQRVFPKEYRIRLDNYFIRESLEQIIKLGRKILKLKSDSVKTAEARKVIKQIVDESVGQLETVWQKFFEDYLLYLFFSYKKILPKVELKNIENEEKKYPDFIGVNHYDGIDIIEIKTHLKNILTWDDRHKNFAFSSEMSKAIIQTINYMDAVSDSRFQKTKAGKELLEYLNIDENLFRPRGIIIISSKNKICKNQNKLSDEQKEQLKRDFTKLRNSIHNVQIFTFDEILDITDRYVQNISIKS